jgi:hypothetical protein
MNDIPAGATYYYRNTYYKFGECYARYYFAKKDCWRDNATVKNEDLALYGVKIKR